MVFPDMRAVLAVQAFHGHPRPDHFRQAVNIERVDHEGVFQFAAHLPGPGFGPEDADPQRGFLGVHALAPHFIADVEHVRGRHHDEVGLEVVDQPDLFFGLAAGHRDHNTAQLFRPVMRAQAAGEQAIAIGDMRLMAGPPARGVDGARHDVRPGCNIFPGIADHRRLAGGARRGVHPHHLFHRHGERTERIIPAQILLAGEGKSGQIAEGAEIFWMRPVRLAFGLEIRHVFIGVPQRPFHALGLQRRDLVTAGGFNGVISPGHVARLMKYPR